MSAPADDMFFHDAQQANNTQSHNDDIPKTRCAESPGKRQSVVIMEKVRTALVPYLCAMVGMLFCFGVTMFGVNVAAIYSQKDIIVDSNRLTDTGGNALQVQIENWAETPFDLPFRLMETKNLNEVDSIQLTTDEGDVMSWTVSKMKLKKITDDAYQLHVVSTAGDTLVWNPAVLEQEDGNSTWADSTPPTIAITEHSGEKHVVSEMTDRRLKLGSKAGSSNYASGHNTNSGKKVVTKVKKAARYYCHCPEPMSCFLCYGNCFPDLKRIICNGHCTTDVHIKSLKEHWNTYGKIERYIKESLRFKCQDPNECAISRGQ